MKNKKVLIIGCGAIFSRHLESIKANKDYKLVGICDIQEVIVKKKAAALGVKGYVNYREAVCRSGANFVVIATPNSLHLEQALYSLENGCDILVEKPVAFDEKQVRKIISKAEEKGQKAYCVLQVRLNPTIEIINKCLEQKLLGNIRSVSLVQRWQRPLEYFSGWRNVASIGGGILYEVGIHYLDILVNTFGVPNVHSAKSYSTKHKHSEIEDTIYAILDYDDFGGTCEITISAEPHNLECSMEILGSNGYVKVGGKAMNIIESYNFLSNGSKVKFETILENNYFSSSPNSYGSYRGSCPNHPALYEKISFFEMKETLDVINIITKIYEKIEGEKNDI